MPYLASTRASIARGSRVGRAMGDTTQAITDPVGKLIAAVNRFGPKAPKGYQYVDPTLPLAKTISPTLALQAALLLHRRALDAVLKYGDAGAIALMETATRAQASPQAYVELNLAAVTDQINAFADSVGAPQFDGFSTTRVFGVPLSTLAIGAAGVAALIFIARKR